MAPNSAKSSSQVHFSLELDAASEYVDVIEQFPTHEPKTGPQTDFWGRKYRKIENQHLPFWAGGATLVIYRHGSFWRQNVLVVSLIEGP
jgi:hypothetical protein